MHRYQLMSQLGDGSFGVVSKAMHTQTGEIVAVKKMKQRFNSWEECLALREIQSLRRLQHPNIIKLKEVVRENTELFMIFEFMEMNVYQITRLRSEQVGSVAQIFNEKEIRSVIAQTLLGLLSIHKGGFMHRDLKPENLLTKGDVVKIADFGLAKEIRSRPPFTEYVSTRWYRAPEIILRSTHYNSPIDIWACGVIFAELYINRPLFPGASDSDQLFKICSVLGAPSPQEWDEGHQLARRLNIRFPTMAPTPLRQLLSNASPAAVDLIEQMLRFNPSDRPTVQQCLQHPFFTGSASNDAAMGGGGGGGGAYHSAGGTATVSSSMFMGISSGQPHNPFHMAAGLPAGGALGQSASGIGGLGAGGGGGGQQPQQQQQQGGSVGGGFGGAGGGGGFHQGNFGAGGGSGGGGSNAGGVGGVGPLHPARNNSPTPGIAAAPVGSYGSYGGGGGAPMSYGGSIGGGGGGGVPGMNYGYGGVGGGGAGGGGGANTGRPLGGVGGAGVGGSASWGPSIGASGASGIPPYSSATQGGGGGVPGYSYGGVGGAGSSALSGMSGMSGIGSGGGHHHAGSPPSPNQQYGMQYGGSSGGGAYSHGVGVGSGGGGGFSTGGVGYAYGGGAGGVGGVGAVGGVRGAGLGGDGRSSSSVHGAPNFHSRTSSSGYEDLAQY